MPTVPLHKCLLGAVWKYTETLQHLCRKQKRAQSDSDSFSGVTDGDEHDTQTNASSSDSSETSSLSSISSLSLLSILSSNSDSDKDDAAVIPFRSRHVF